MFDFDSSGLRKSKYYMTPNEEKELSSISGVELNPQLSNIYRAGIYARDSDIRNVIRYNDISKGHSNKNSLSVLKSDAENPRLESNVVKDLQTEIKIMIEIIEDAEIQLYMKSVYKENKNNGKEFLEKMLE